MRLVVLLDGRSAGSRIPIFPGGALVGLVLMVNLVAAQGRRLELSARKAGIWIVHAGLILLFVGEFITGGYQVDARLVFEEGQTANYVEVPRELELAVVDATDPAVDDVYGVSERALGRGGTVADPRHAALGPRRRLPAQRAARAGPARRADRGRHRRASASASPSGRSRPSRATSRSTSRSPWSRCSPAAAASAPGSRATRSSRGSRSRSRGRSYALELRNRREYLPYTLTLEDFRHDVYPGTDIPKNFSSLVRLQNPARGEDRERPHLHEPAAPLRRQGVLPGELREGRHALDPAGGRRTRAGSSRTSRRVLVTVGLLVHFAHLAPARPPPRRRRAAVARAGGRMNATGSSRRWSRARSPSRAPPRALVPPRPVRGFDVDAFGRLPVLEGGRVKPVDSVARNSLLVIRGAQSFQHEGRSVGPDEWLLDVLFRPDVADAQAIFQIDDPDVLGVLGLPQSSQRRYAFTTLAPHLEALERQATAAQKVDAKQRTRFQGAVVNLAERVYLYFRLKNTIQLERSPGLVDGARRGAVGRSRRSATRRSPGSPTSGRSCRPRAPRPRRGAPPARRSAARRSASAIRRSRRGRASASPGRCRSPASFDRAVTDLRARAHAAASRLEAVGQVEHEVALQPRRSPSTRGW